MLEHSTNSVPQPLAVSSQHVPSSEAVNSLQEEIQEYAQDQALKRRVFPRAALVGVLAGLVAVWFRWVLLLADSLRNQLIAWMHHLGSGGWLVGWLFPLLWGAIGAFLAALIVRYWSPESAGSGIPFLKSVLYQKRNFFWLRLLPAKFIGGVLAIGGGLALGREGPTVQMGGAVGAGVAYLFKSIPRERLSLIAAGAGAGLAAAFNAPLAGLTFVIEELLRDFAPIAFGAALLASSLATVVSRLFSGQFPDFRVPEYPAPPLEALGAFVVLGLLAGLLGVTFNKSLLWVVTWADGLQMNRIQLSLLIGGGMGVLAWFAPSVVGGGHNLVEAVLSNQIAWGWLLPLLVLRFGLTLISYAAGTAGGIFAPFLVLGALLGQLAGVVNHWLFPQASVPIEAFAVVGMAALFTSIVRAPLTGTVLILEMTSNFNQILMVLAACFAAYSVAEALNDKPIYEALLQRDLTKPSGSSAEAAQP
ncbi:MAG: H(+)/Cl(-) exchange transporter ClcA [Thermaceae bacterium]|nr:H(+)/Cl(-) exchange transporter ClcA [Thermaceae bacterium]